MFRRFAAWLRAHPLQSGGGYVPTKTGSGKHPPQESGTGRCFVGTLPYGELWREAPLPDGSRARILNLDVFKRALAAAGSVR